MGFWDAFTGKSQRNDILQGQDQANAAIRAALNQASGTTGEYLDKSLAYLAPQLQTGGNAISLLGDVLGVNGQGPQQAYFSNFQNDPGFNATLNAGVGALDASAANKGLLRSGGQMKSLFDFGQRHLTDAFNTRTNNLFNLAGFGQGAANTSAGLTADAGKTLADMQFGTGQLFANNAINTQNAVAQSRSTPINNILGLGNMFANIAGSGANLVKAFKPAPTFNFKA